MDSLASLDIPNDIVRRITLAAYQLHEENGRSTFPNVDAVRRKARVNMNDASAVMRAWRRNQTAAAAPLTSRLSFRPTAGRSPFNRPARGASNSGSPTATDRIRFR